MLLTKKHQKCSLDTQTITLKFLFVCSEIEFVVYVNIIACMKLLNKNYKKNTWIGRTKYIFPCFYQVWTS